MTRTVPSEVGEGRGKACPWQTGWGSTSAPSSTHRNSDLTTVIPSTFLLEGRRESQDKQKLARGGFLVVEDAKAPSSSPRLPEPACCVSRSPVSAEGQPPRLLEGWPQ